MSMRGGRGAYGYDDAPPARDGYATRGAREGGGGGRGAYNGGGGNDFQPDQDARGSSFIYRSGGTGGRGAFSNGGDDFRSQDRDSYENRDSFAQRGGSSMRGGRGGGEFGGGGARDSFGNHGGGYDERPPERSEFSTGGGGRGGASAGRGAYDRNDSFDQRGPPQGGRGGGSIFPNDRPPRNDYAEQDRYAPSGGRGGSQNFGNDRSNGYSGGGGRGDGGYESNDNQQGGFRGGGQSFGQRGGGPGRGGFNNGGDFHDGNRDAYGQDSFRGGGAPRGGRGGGPVGRGEYGQNDSFGPSRGGRGGGGNFGGDDGGFSGGRGGGAPRGGGYGQSDGGFAGRGGRGGGGSFRGGHSDGFGDQDNEGQFGGGGFQGGRGGGQGGGSRGCFNCGQEGHMSRDCPNPRDESRRPMGGGGGGPCYNCGQEGHMSRECPNGNNGLFRQQRPMEGTSVSVNSAYGEYKISQNKNKIHLEGCDILIGTPGRLKHFMGPEIFEVPVDDRKTFLFDYLEKLKEQNNGEMPKTLMFVETKRDADTLAFAINEKGTPAQTELTKAGQEVPEFLSKATEPLPFEYATVNPDGTPNDAAAEVEEPDPPSLVAFVLRLFREKTVVLLACSFGQVPSALHLSFLSILRDCGMFVSQNQMSEAEHQPAAVPPPSEQPADAVEVAEATAESAPAENPPADGSADGVPVDGALAEEPPTQQKSDEAQAEDAVVQEVVASAIVAVEAEVQPPEPAKQSEMIEPPPNAEEPPREEERPEEDVPPPPEGDQQPAAPPNEQPEGVEVPEPPAALVEERPQEAAAEEVDSPDEEPPLDRVPLPMVPPSHQLDHDEEEYRRQQQAQFDLKANRVEGPRVPFQFAERRAEDLWEDDEQQQRPQAEAEQDEEDANGEAEVPDELPPTPPSLEAQDEAASTRSLAGSLAGSELRVDGDSKPEDAPAVSDEKPPVEEANKPESAKAEADEQKEAADAKPHDEKPKEVQETPKVEPPVPQRQDSWENDGFDRESKPAAVASSKSQDLVDPWASDPEDSPPAARKISTVAAEDTWGDDVPTVTSEQWKAAADPEPKKVEENRNFSSPSHNPRGGGHFGGSSRGGASGRGGTAAFGGRGRGGFNEQPARNDYQRSNGRGDGHRADENARSDRHTSSYEETKRPSANTFGGNNQRSFGGRGGQDGGGWEENRSAQRPNDRPPFPQHPNNNFNDNNRQSTGGYAGGGRGEANGGFNAHNQRSFGGHQQANERYEDERQHQRPYHQNDRQQQQQSYDNAPHKRQSEAKVNEWLDYQSSHDQHSQKAYPQDVRSQDARSQQRPPFQYRRQPNEQEHHGNSADWGNRSTGSGQRGGGYERDEYRNSHVQGGRQPANERHDERDFGQRHQSYDSQRGNDQWNTSNGYENPKPFGGNGDHARHEPRGGFRSNDYEQQPQNGDRNRAFCHSEGAYRDHGRPQDNNNRDYQRDYQRQDHGEFDRQQFSGGAANERCRNEHNRSGHEQLQEGEAPSFRHTLFGGYVPKDRPAHEPSFRSTDEIFDDDEQKKDRYAVIADEDGGVVVHNLPHNEEVQHVEGRHARRDDHREHTPVTVNVAYGEYKTSLNKNKIHTEGCDILIGTPGRLYALMLEGFIKYQQLQYFVLDEADELIRSMHEEITAFISLQGFPPAEKRQTLMFAATFSPELRTAGEAFCRPKAIVIRNKMNDLNKRVLQQVLQVPYNDRFTYLAMNKVRQPVPDFLKDAAALYSQMEATDDQ
ncbi:RNA helicase [Aphelenchoides fujianensis]|nr:RNA helicase [Aphelenchoides fujianensis]